MPVLSSCHSVPFWSVQSCLLAYCGVLISVFQFSGLPAICLLVASGPRALVITLHFHVLSAPGPQPDHMITAYLTHTAHMATMPRNMLTLKAKSLPHDLHSEPKSSQFYVKNRVKTDFKAKMQNITKHHYLLCSVKVSHPKKPHTLRPMGP